MVSKDSLQSDSFASETKKHAQRNRLLAPISWLRRWVTLNHYSVPRTGWYEHIVMQHFFRLKYLHNIIIYVNILFTDIYNYDIKRFNIIKLHYFEIFHVKVLHFWQKYSREGFYHVRRPQKYRQRTRSKVGWTRLWTQATDEKIVIPYERELMS